MFIVLLSASQFCYAQKCEETHLPPTLKSSLDAFEASPLSNTHYNRSMLDSLRLIQNVGLKVSAGHQYRFSIEFRALDTEGKVIDRTKVLSGFNDLEIKDFSESTIWIVIPYSRLASFLKRASLPEFSNAVSEMQVRDIEADVKANQTSVIRMEKPREVSIQNSYIDRFISGMNAQRPELVTSANVSAGKVETRTYLQNRQYFLTVPKSLTVNHSYGKKYDRFIQLGTAELLAAAFKVELGDDNIFSKSRERITAISRFQNITAVKVNILNIKATENSEIPYKITIQIELTGWANSNFSGPSSKQLITAEVNFNGVYIDNPYLSILDFREMR